MYINIFKRIYFLGSCVQLYFLLLLYCLCIITSYYYYSLLDFLKRKQVRKGPMSYKLFIQNKMLYKLFFCTLGLKGPDFVSNLDLDLI